MFRMPGGAYAYPDTFSITNTLDNEHIFNNVSNGLHNRVDAAHSAGNLLPVNGEAVGN